MIKAAKRKVNNLSVTSPDGVIDDIVKLLTKTGMSGITLRHAGQFKVKGQILNMSLLV